MKTAFASLLFMGASVAFGQQLSACGSLQNAYGPYDYRKERTGMLEIVERAHFTPEVEMLVRGKAGYLGGDLDYTLRASPNHHRALAATARLAEREGNPQPRNMRYSVDCWFDRGMRFAPDDHVVRFLFVQYLIRTKRAAQAPQHLDHVAAMNPPEALTWLNLALLNADLGRWEIGRTQAEQARAMGLERAPVSERFAAAGFALRSPEELASMAPASAPASAAASAPASTPASAPATASGVSP